MSGLVVHLAVAPALPLHAAGKYVAGAYIVFLAIVLIYVAIMASRLGRTERELDELRRDVLARRSGSESSESAESAESAGESGREQETVA